MSTGVMHRPTATPPSNELQYGLHHIARHNASSPVQSDWKGTDDYSQALPFQSNYGSPGLMRQSDDLFLSEPYGDNHHQSPPHHDPGTNALGIRYSGYESQSELLSADPNALGQSPYVEPLNNTNNPMPMTPRSNTSLGVRTRNGRSVARSTSPSVFGSQSNARVTKTRPKKSRSNKAINSKTPKLDAPLSELTKDMEIPVRDMVAWVNRSDEERQAEVEKRNGYIARPMNSFMLYRSAFAERTKQWCLQNNHQVVSLVSGESWPMESEDVREHYNNLARIERENHARAHPSYKFSPSKTPAAAKKKRSDYMSDEDDEGNETDSGDPDWEWRPRNECSVRGKPKRQGREVGHAGYASNSHDNPMFDKPSFEFDMGVNGYGWDSEPPPMPYHMEPFKRYDQSYFMQPQMGFAEQSYMATGFQDSMSTGMPEMGPADMFQSHAQMLDNGGHQVDPMLLSVNEHEIKSEETPLGNGWDEQQDLFGAQDVDRWAMSGQM